MARLNSFERQHRDCRTETIAMRIITIALLIALAALAPANAQDATFHDRAGRVTGSERTDATGVTTFHDRAGRVTGTAWCS